MLGGVFRRQLHVSYLITGLCLGVCIGLVLARLIGLSVGWSWLIVGLALSIGAFKNRRLIAVVFVLLAGVLIGGQRGSSYLQATNGYGQFVNRQVTITAVVADDPGEAINNLAQINLKKVSVNGQSLPGQMYATAMDTLAVKRGDQVTVSGKLGDGFGSFQAVIHRANLIKVTRQTDVIRDIRENFAAGVERVSSPNEAALGLGFVVGQRSSLPPELDNSLRMVGLTHIVVASGYNLTILVRFARRLLARWSRFLATGVSGVLMFGFALFSGFSASMNRAVLVTGLSLLAWHFGRRFHPLMLIIYTSALTAYLNPNYIWGDVGWYLSFLAFSGVLIVAPLIAKLVLRTDKPNSILQVVIETLAAQVMTLPLILLVFGQLPNLALIANALVAPVIPLSMLMTTVAGLIGIAIPALTGLGSVLMHFSVGYVLAVVDWLSQIPGAQSLLSLPVAWLAVIYGAVIVSSGLIWWLTHHDFLETGVVD